MTELDLTEAIEEATEVVEDRMRDLGDEVTGEDDWWGLTFEGPLDGDAADIAKCAVEAVAPLIERQVRERVAQELETAGDLTALTMTTEAAERFKTALLHAAARIPQAMKKQGTDPMDHADWLRWGANRIDAAITRADASPATEPTKETA